MNSEENQTVYENLLDFMELTSGELPRIFLSDEEPVFAVEFLRRNGILERSQEIPEPVEERSGDIGFMDVLGVYDADRTVIIIYARLIARCAHAIDLSPEELMNVVVAHELAHAASHLGLDGGGDVWEEFEYATRRDKEFFAQLFPYLLFREAGDTSYCECMVTLAKYQPDIYRTFLDHTEIDTRDAANMLLEARMRDGESLTEEPADVCQYCGVREATTSVQRRDTWARREWAVPACRDCALSHQQIWMT